MNGEEIRLTADLLNAINDKPYLYSVQMEDWDDNKTQYLTQLKTLFADGAWEGIVGNCDTFIYLGGNEASTYEYVSKLLGKWTIDKRTSGKAKAPVAHTVRTMMYSAES